MSVWLVMHVCSGCLVVALGFSEVAGGDALGSERLVGREES